MDMRSAKLQGSELLLADTAGGNVLDLLTCCVVAAADAIGVNRQMKRRRDTVVRSSMKVVERVEIVEPYDPIGQSQSASC